MNDQKLLLEEFIEWLSDKDDVYYAFDKTKEAIDEFFQIRKKEEEQ